MSRVKVISLDSSAPPYNWWKLQRQLKDRINERMKREAAAQDAAEQADETKRKLQADYRKDR